MGGFFSGTQLACLASHPGAGLSISEATCLPPGGPERCHVSIGHGADSIRCPGSPLDLKRELSSPWHGAPSLVGLGHAPLAPGFGGVRGLQAHGFPEGSAARGTAWPPCTAVQCLWGGVLCQAVGLGRWNFHAAGPGAAFCLWCPVSRLFHPPGGVRSPGAARLGPAGFLSFNEILNVL